MDGAVTGLRLMDPASGEWGFTLRLTFLTDWHVGTGTGRPGSIDRLVARDLDDLPWVPAKTLTGIYRDACERLAHALDLGDEGTGPEAGTERWSDLVDDIFGTQPALNQEAEEERPRKAALSLRGARFPETLVKRLAHPDAGALRAALTFIKPGVAIDPRSGRAADEHLRFDEMARKGAVLEAVGTLDLGGMGEARAADACALLVAATRLADRLGGKRRRGAGRLRLTIAGQTDADVEAALSWLERHPTPAPRADKPSQPAPSLAIPSSTGGVGGFVRVALSVVLDSPLSVTRRSLGNLVEALDHVPGNSLLPLVARAFARKGFDVHGAIRRGDLRVLPLTPEVGGERGRPMPFALAAIKDAAGSDEGRVVNRLAERPSRQLKPLREGYLALQGGALRIEKIEPILRTHNVIDDPVQRPTEEVGGLYSYQAIPAGTRLRGELWVRPDLAAELDHAGAFAALAGQGRLGRSKKDDYGAVTISVLGPPTPVADEIGATTDDRLVVWCLSDILLRSPTLRPATTVEDLAEALRQGLGGGFVVRPVTPSKDEETITAAVRVRRIDSWHERWGLPRPSLVAIQAGSCAVFTVLPRPDPKTLEALAVEGIGERRAEGFGRIAINPAVLARKDLRKTDDAVVANKEAGAPAWPSLPLNAPETAFACLLEEEAWRAAVRQAALLVGADRHVRRRLHLPEKPGDAPRMSQLGNLRAVLQRLRGVEDREAVALWFEHLESVRQRRKRWPENALRAFRELVSDAEAVWRLMEARLSPPLLLTGRTTAELKTLLWAEAVRAVFEAVFHNHKRALDGQEEETHHGA
ncbi:MAG TPA: RAMP superfamily CRISPR-associated protein [Azospirillaceae bacterium]|nr:RAMP superfamily CRISPR-associated protein [Azospirillaceae bacterium]